MKNLEALVYTKNRAIAVSCARAFSELPIDWIILDEESLALEYLSREQFEFILVDLDSGSDGSMLASIVASGVNEHSVVLAITSGPVDPNSLVLCYKSQVFYPVRPRTIEEVLYTAVPFAERISFHQRHADRSFVSSAECPENSHGSRAVGARFAALSALARQATRATAAMVREMLHMRHSLSELSQERISSVLAGVALAWFVQEATVNFSGVQSIAPPTPGPTYLFALAFLLWLCAKHRRVCTRSAEATMPAQTA